MPVMLFSLSLRSAAYVPRRHHGILLWPSSTATRLLVLLP
jgi:hypothetical protein